MTNAIKNKLKINDQKAKKIAIFVMDTFGYETRIIDNILKPSGRQLFYMLEAEGFLTTGRERSRLHDGREWMTHYWTLRQIEIHRFSKSKMAQKFKDKIIIHTAKLSNPTVYNSLSEDIWLTRKILNH